MWRKNKMKKINNYYLFIFPFQPILYFWNIIISVNNVGLFKNVRYIYYYEMFTNEYWSRVNEFLVSFVLITALIHSWTNLKNI